MLIFLLPSRAQSQEIVGQVRNVESNQLGKQPNNIYFFYQDMKIEFPLQEIGLKKA